MNAQEREKALPELLRLAAKAMFPNLKVIEITHDAVWIEDPDGEGEFIFIPQKDDGQSRRLQVAIKADLIWGGKNPFVAAMVYPGHGKCMIDKFSDASEAARWAVLLCAAEVGRGMD